MHAPRATLRPAKQPDLPTLERLLTRAHLSTRGVAEVLANFVVAEQAGRLIGSVGFESYEPDALLRSAAVDPEFRGTGIGRALVDDLLERVRRRGTRDVYLLTTTAEQWFPRFGFERTTRDAVPAAVQASVEFREICSTSAVVMVKRLSG